MSGHGAGDQSSASPIRSLPDTKRVVVQEMPLTATRTPARDDRRSLRTRGALREALIELITERGWDDIAVQDVCERANVGRSTFYSHYPNKDALLLGGLEDLRVALQHQARAREAPAGGLRFALGLIEHAQQQRKVFRGLIGRRSGYVVQQRFREMVIRLVADELPPSPNGLPRQALARWIAGAFVELLGWWVEQRTPVPPAELAAWVNELARPALSPLSQLTGSRRS
ncbi:MAG TPA: TetR/AcrR family transcriptional regulator [Albitalea sp.]|nr:TetR/AcrR family transcriptional regulator [Albitalea sp.]